MANKNTEPSQDQTKKDKELQTIKLKAEVFDLLEAQASLQNQINQIEQVKQHKIAELRGQ